MARQKEQTEASQRHQTDELNVGVPRTKRARRFDGGRRRTPAPKRGPSPSPVAGRRPGRPNTSAGPPCSGHFPAAPSRSPANRPRPWVVAAHAGSSRATTIPFPFFSPENKKKLLLLFLFSQLGFLFFFEKISWVSLLALLFPKKGRRDMHFLLLLLLAPRTRPRCPRAYHEAPVPPMTRGPL
jgi:hypothetical protein